MLGLSRKGRYLRYNIHWAQGEVGEWQGGRWVGGTGGGGEVGGWQGGRWVGGTGVGGWVLP